MSRNLNRRSILQKLLFVLVIILIIAVAIPYIHQKLVFLNLFFLPVILASLWLGARCTISIALLCILVMATYIFQDPGKFIPFPSKTDLYSLLFSWGGLLIVSGLIIGRQRERLQSGVDHTRQISERLAESSKSFMDARSATILGLAKLAEYRDNETGAHIERMREYVRILALELSNHPKYQGFITNDYIKDLYESSILHDIGKVAVPDKILRKHGRLTMLEFEVIKTHTTLGGDALKEVEARVKGESFLNVAKEIAYFHHERWDGNGYPDGLKGEEIPLAARLTALADFFDALTTKRVYKAASSIEETKDLIVANKGLHFDPDVVDAFLIKFNEFATVRQRYRTKTN